MEPSVPAAGMTPLVAEGLLQLLWKLNYWQIQQKDPEEVSEGGWAPESLPGVGQVHHDLLHSPHSSAGAPQTAD